jgi:hypothetical protein
MGGISGIAHRRAVRALEKIGYHVAREGKHIVMVKGPIIITIPRHDPIDSYTMAGIVRSAGLTPDEFRALLCSPDIMRNIHPTRGCHI